MNASPTRKQSTPLSRIRLTSAGCRIPLSVMTMRSGGMPLQQSERDIEPRLESVQIAVVDADQRGLQFERAIEFDGIMHFDEHGHAEVGRDRRQFLHAPRVQRSDDQQDAIRAHRTRFVDLVRVQHEIFAQDRQTASGARLRR